jgi:hypothetical protein
MRQQFESGNPGSRVGVVQSVLQSPRRILAVGDVPVGDFRRGDAMTIVGNPEGQVLTNGTVARIAGTALHVWYEEPRQGMREPRPGDLAIRFEAGARPMTPTTVDRNTAAPNMQTPGTGAAPETPAVPSTPAAPKTPAAPETPPAVEPQSGGAGGMESGGAAAESGTAPEKSAPETQATESEESTPAPMTEPAKVETPDMGAEGGATTDEGAEAGEQSHTTQPTDTGSESNDTGGGGGGGGDSDMNK